MGPEIAEIESMYPNNREMERFLDPEIKKMVYRSYIG
jgi:hypothetical protein